MKKKILALLLIFIIMASSITSYANKDDVPKIYTPNRIPPHTLKY